MSTLLHLTGLFSVLSLLSVGGGNGVIPAMQRAAVETYGWMSQREFLDLFAISRASPGPGSLIVVLIGQKAAGLLGAMVALLAMYVPSGVIVHVAARSWHRARQAAWRERVERGLAPVAVGLTYGSALALVRGTESGWLAWALTAAATLLLAFTEVPPLAVLGAAALAAFVVG